MKTKALRSIIIVIIFVVPTTGCVKEYLEVQQKPKPKVGKQTESLEASFVSSAISSVNDPYWNGADYILVEMEDLSTKNLYKQDGLFNMTGTYYGVNDFNGGELPVVKLRAAYDTDRIYILATWNDSRIHPYKRAWLWNGEDDPLKPGVSTNGWTSQRNDDNIALGFDINGASGTLGTFAEVGCASGCHEMGNEFKMEPETGGIDIWQWSVALSAPFGYALDLVAIPDSGVRYDAGTRFVHRNSVNPGDNRSGPAYEWDGSSQDITTANGAPSKLDPGYFLLSKTAFVGDPALGEVLYTDHDKGCKGCHGEKGVGYGLQGDGPPFNSPSFSRKFSRTNLDNYASNSEHEGNSYYTKLSQDEKDHLVAYLRGLAGVPGYYLSSPVSGESLTDVGATSHVNFVRLEAEKPHDTYEVLFIRKLKTGNTDDIQFDLASNRSYPFGVALMDNDGKNHIGSPYETLIFLGQ